MMIAVDVVTGKPVVGYADDYVNWADQDAALDAAGRRFHEQMASLRAREAVSGSWPSPRAASGCVTPRPKVSYKFQPVEVATSRP